MRIPIATIRTALRWCIALRLLHSQGLQPKSEQTLKLGTVDRVIFRRRSVKLALSRSKGTWGIALVCHPNNLIVGKSDASWKLFPASIISAFAHHTRDYITLEDVELVVLDLYSMDRLVKAI